MIISKTGILTKLSLFVLLSMSNCVSAGNSLTCGLVAGCALVIGVRAICHRINSVLDGLGILVAQPPTPYLEFKTRESKKMEEEKRAMDRLLNQMDEEIARKGG
jgi:hypothetical protein